MSNRSIRLILSTLFLFTFILSSAKSFVVKGNVVDQDGEPEIYATVRIYTPDDTVTPRSMGITDINGQYDIVINDSGDYRLVITSVGKIPAVRNFNNIDNKSVVTLDTIVTEINNNVIGEIVVEAARPLVAVEVDRIVYDVSADTESRTAMLSVMLNKVPMVSVDPDGTIKVNGSTDFMVYKNGRPNNTFSRNAKDIFKSLPAAMIQRIEVITDPGAREDAEATGAILNIITVKNTMVKGVMGNAEISFNSKTTDIPTPHLWLSGQYGKLSMSVYGGGSLSTDGSSRTRSISTTKYLETGNRLRSESRSSGHGRLGYWGVESSLDIDRNNLLTLELNGFISSNNSIFTGNTEMTDADGKPIYHYTTAGNDGHTGSNDFNMNLSYQHSTGREGEDITLSYRFSGNNHNSLNDNRYFSDDTLPMEYSGVLDDTSEHGTEHTLQFDWSRKINDNHAIDLGSKFIYRCNESESQREYMELRTDYSAFRHSTGISAVYADYRFNSGNWGFRGGVRYEYSAMCGKFPDGSDSRFSTDLSDVTPNASVMYKPDSHNTFKLSYGSRIQRPGIIYLNPAVKILPDITTAGNPDLKSTRQNTLMFTYSLMRAKVSLNFDAGYIFYDNGIIGIESTEDDHTFSGYGNAGSRHQLHIANYTSWRLSAKTSIVLSTSADHVDISNRSNGDRTSGWGYSAFTSLNQKMPLDFMMVFAIGYKRHVPDLYTRKSPIGLSNLMCGLRLHRSFLKDERLTVSFELMNPLRPRRPGEITESWNNGMVSQKRSYNNHMTSFAFAIGYRFGNMKTSVRKANKTINNDDVIG